MGESEKVFDSPWYPEPDPSFFVVELAFDSHTEGYRFDPKGTVLTLDDGRQMHPQASYGPFIASVILKKEISAFMCKPWPKDRELEASLEIHGDVQACVALRFNVPPPLPDESFSIQLGELAFEGTVVALPAIEYKETKHVSSMYQ